MFLPHVTPSSLFVLSPYQHCLGCVSQIHKDPCGHRLDQHSQRETTASEGSLASPAVDSPKSQSNTKESLDTCPSPHIRGPRFAAACLHRSRQSQAPVVSSGRRRMRSMCVALNRSPPSVLRACRTRPCRRQVAPASARTCGRCREP
jgi:hypothetical protein